MGRGDELWLAYRLRWKRRRLIARSIRARRDLTARANRTDRIRPGDILCFLCVRNEAARLPYLLAYYRRLGVAHFLVVDNGSDDGTAELLASRDDVSLWHTLAGYRASRFGMDWLGWLLFRHGHGHWCLTVDADELLVFPDSDTQSLRDLTARLDRDGQGVLPAVMIDLYPRCRLSEAGHEPGTDPVATLGWFDSGGYSVRWQPITRSHLVQGGPRARMFFRSDPRRAPTLNKLPLVRWNRRFAYLNATHTALPRSVNAAAGVGLSGALLHTKFLNLVVGRAGVEKARGEHFNDPPAFAEYYDAIAADPVLWSDLHSARYEGWRQLRSFGLISG